MLELMSECAYKKNVVTFVSSSAFFHIDFIYTHTQQQQQYFIHAEI